MSEAIIKKKTKINRVETIYNYINQVINVYVNNTYRLQTDVITSNTSYSIPSHYGNIYVRCFGGGGGGAQCAGGGGGWMNNGEFNIPNGTSVSITIGAGGRYPIGFAKNGTAGGTTSFGTYLSANGGEGGKNDSRNDKYVGGNGGSGGGGANYEDQSGYGGTGYQFGGGGGGAKGSGGSGGTWGGRGGYAVNGTNTIGWKNVAVDENRSYITGYGRRGTGNGAGAPGGGGFGGNGGNTNYPGGGGGGGYGAKGGNGGSHAGGGGGGFGSKGAGGDGGYVNPGGGGGYGRGAQYCEYKLGPGNNMTWYTAGYGGGGAGSFSEVYFYNYTNYMLGGSGVCIVQYYKKV